MAPIYVNNVGFEVQADTSTFFEYAAAASNTANRWSSAGSSFSYVTGTFSGAISGAISALEAFSTDLSKAEVFGELTNSMSLLDDENRAATIKMAVLWFKSEDLALLYKVLDDPQSFGVISIEPGSYVEDVLLDTVSAFNSCIVGALAIAKLPPDPTVETVEELANNIVADSNIALGVLDMIIDKGYLGEFKAEIHRQMAER